jgi:hypothetical protein
MIPLALALELKEAGLLWQTSDLDFFAIPDRGLDDRVFVLADMMAYTELVRGWPVVSFHGAAEWALDYILTSEVVWMPTEEQLREALAARLAMINSHGEFSLSLTHTPGGYRCAIDFGEDGLLIDAPTAGEAYGRALLRVLRGTDNQ